MVASLHRRERNSQQFSHENEKGCDSRMTEDKDLEKMCLNSHITINVERV